MWFTLRIVLLGLWVGAMAAFAFIFAPIAFAHVGATPAFAATIAACVRALVRTGDALALLAALATVAGGLDAPPRSILIVACLLVATACGVYETHTIVPLMESTPLSTPAYAALHRESSSVFGIAFLAALAAFIASSIPRRTR